MNVFDHDVSSKNLSHSRSLLNALSIPLKEVVSKHTLKILQTDTLEIKALAVWETSGSCLGHFRQRSRVILAIVIVVISVSTFLYSNLYTPGKDEFEILSFPASSVVLAAVGDCSGYNIARYRGESADPLVSVRSLIEKSDIFVFNMEGALLPPEYLGFSTHHPQQSCFVSPPSFAGLMKVGKLTVATLANNHILDGGGIGVKETRKALEANGIHHVGAGSNAMEACQPLLLTVKGVKIGFLAYNLVNELAFSAREEGPGAASFVACNVTQDLCRVRREADVLVVVLHWGRSWTEVVASSQIVIAERMFEAGADLVIGHHPHMLQAIKAYENKLAIFSLGNFVLRPDYSMPSDAHNSLVAFIEIAERKVRRCYLCPVRLDDHGVPRLPTELEAKVILSNLADLSEAFNTEIVTKKRVGVIDMPDDKSVAVEIVVSHFVPALSAHGLLLQRLLCHNSGGPDRMHLIN